MSRGYRVGVPQVVAQVTARAEDQATLGLDLLAILPPEEMMGLLREALAEAGWREEGAALRREISGVDARLEGDEITLTARREAQITGRGASKQQAEIAAEAQLEGKQARLAEGLSAQLERAARALGVELEAAIQGVYGRALRRRAAQMGEISSVVEREVNGEIELTIKVTV
ncbi:hypothetical protein KKF91_15450 [Myxococcota bacterium]|nr:hypothetical protein [Myxococcota bacterium]MBU1431936.1 hypothetical protein [Myxococcota bacterium]MBU1897160.1 hypothetical protein [Myxococcota bacterium]